MAGRRWPGADGRARGADGEAPMARRRWRVADGEAPMAESERERSRSEEAIGVGTDAGTARAGTGVVHRRGCRSRFSRNGYGPYSFSSPCSRSRPHRRRRHRRGRPRHPSPSHHHYEGLHRRDGHHRHCHLLVLALVTVVVVVLGGPIFSSPHYMQVVIAMAIAVASSSWTPSSVAKPV